MDLSLRESRIEEAELQAALAQSAEMEVDDTRPHPGASSSGGPRLPTGTPAALHPSGAPADTRLMTFLDVEKRGMRVGVVGDRDDADLPRGRSILSIPDLDRIIDNQIAAVQSEYDLGPWRGDRSQFELPQCLQMAHDQTRLQQQVWQQLRHFVPIWQGERVLPTLLRDCRESTTNALIGGMHPDAEAHFPGNAHQATLMRACDCLAMPVSLT